MLTKRAVAQLRWDPAGPATQVLYDDGGVPGFGVRVRPSGRKTFVLWYRNAGRRLRMLTLGTYGKVLTVDEARKLARKQLARVADGRDPAEERKAARQGATVSELADAYIERHAKRQNKTWEEDWRRLNRYVLPALGTRKVADVSRTDVARLHDKIGGTAPYAANRLLALLSSMFARAEEWNFVPEGAPNPARLITKFPQYSRDRYVKPAEMPHLVAAINAEDNLYVRAALKLYLLTGLRRSELLNLRWSDVDLKERTLRLGDTKAGRPHLLPLSEPVLEILRDLPRLLGNPYVLPGDTPRQPRVNISKPWLRVRARLWLAQHPEEAEELRREAEADVRARKRDRKHASERPKVVEARLLTLAEEKAGGPDALRLHDLRRTVGSWLAMSGASLPLIGKVLNHSNASTTQVYARIADDAPRAALEDLGAKMVAAGVRAG